MKLFAFLLVVLIGAAQAFVAPSAFKGTAMTSPRATRGERIVRIEESFRERDATRRPLDHVLSLATEAMHASMPSSPLALKRHRAPRPPLFCMCIFTCVFKYARVFSLFMFFCPQPCSIVGPPFLLCFSRDRCPFFGRGGVGCCLCCVRRVLYLVCQQRGSMGKPVLGGFWPQVRENDGEL